MTEQVQPCPSCVRAKRSPAAWRHTGESCGHVECPNRRPLTACPPGYTGDYPDAPYIDPDAWARAERDA